MVKNSGTVIVTGGCGYIGSHTIVELLDKTDFEVISIDNFVNSSDSTLKRIEKLTGNEIINHNIDLRNKDEVQRIFANIPDIKGVIHFAALKSVPESVVDPLLYYNNNIQSLLNVLRACQINKVESFIFSSSCSVYGNVDVFPVNEESKLEKAESPYGHTKQIGEDITENFSKICDLKTISLRYFNPAGAHPSGELGELPINKPSTLVPVLTMSAQNNSKFTVFGGNLNTRDGSCVRDYVHVMDIASAHIKALEYASKNDLQYDVFNLGSGEGVTVLEAINAFEEKTGIQLNYQIGKPRVGDVEAIFSDCEKANLKLAWKAARRIEDIVSSAWLWQQNLKYND